MNAHLTRFITRAVPTAELAIVPLAMMLHATAAASPNAEPQVSAQIAPRAEIAPRHAIPSLPGDRLPAFHCDDSYCGFDALRDLWKRDALKPAPSEYLNADSVIIARSRFAAEVERFGDPHAPATLTFKIPGLPLCFGSYSVNGGPGLHSC